MSGNPDQAAYVSAIAAIDDDLRRVILAACKSFALTHTVFALPSLVSSNRPLLSSYGRRLRTRTRWLPGGPRSSEQERPSPRRRPSSPAPRHYSSASCAL
jgi:hypothetical protein